MAHAPFDLAVLSCLPLRFFSLSLDSFFFFLRRIPSLCVLFMRPSCRLSGFGQRRWGQSIVESVRRRESRECSGTDWPGSNECTGEPYLSCFYLLLCNPAISLPPTLPHLLPVGFP
ncbi:unnamed protein product, partial [Discosporangium mesarthrocarpum]